MNQQLKDAYAQLNEQHPDLFKGCPAEIPQIQVKKNSVARQFDAFTDAGLCFTDEYFEREVNSLTDEASENDEQSSEGETIYIYGGVPTAEQLAWVEENKFTCKSYIDSISSRIQRNYLKKQDSKDKAYHDVFTGTGKPETNVIPFDGYKEKIAIVHNHYDVDYNYLQHDGYHVFQLTLDCYYHSCAPGPQDVKLENGLETQLKEFGKKIFIPVGRKGQSKKYEKKQAALVNALSRAFAPRSIRPSEATIKTLHLETTSTAEESGQSWTPVTPDPIDVLMDEEQQEIRARKARHELVKVRQHLGADKWSLLMESLQKTAVQIADEINANGGDTNAAAIRQRLKRVRKALETLGCHVCR